MKRVRGPVIRHRSASCDESLRNGLAAKHAAGSFLKPSADEPVPATRSEVEQQEELGNEPRRASCSHGRIRHGSSALRGKLRSVNVCQVFATALLAIAPVLLHRANRASGGAHPGAQRKTRPARPDGSLFVLAKN